MPLKFLKISSYYRGFLNDYYQKFPDIACSGYAEQYAHLMGQYFAWSDNYGRLLKEKGLETMEIVANAEPLQKAWASEHSLPSALSLNAIVLEQISFFNPHVIYFQDSISFNGSFIEKLKIKFPEIRLYIGNLCAPFTSSQIEDFKVFDYFTVCSPFFKRQLKRFEIESVIIPHAFDKRILEKVNKDNPYPKVPFTFIGSLFADEGFHSMRLQILENLEREKIPFAFYGNLPDQSLTGLLKRKASFAAAHILDRLGLKQITENIPSIRKGRNHETMPRRLRLSKDLYNRAMPPVFGLDMFKALKKASIGFNIHIDCAGDYAANMRLFETTGVGTCLVTDRKSNLSNLFEEDEEVVVYSNVDECVKKIKWLIAHPDYCQAIAKKGQQRTLSQHTFESRVDKFYTTMMQHIEI